MQSQVLNPKTKIYTGANKMNVTIIGAGNMGRGIGTRAAAGGHSVTFVDANPEVAEQTAAEVKKVAKNGSKISTSGLGDVQPGDIVVLAVWYGTNIEIAKQLGGKLAGKVVVDIANPLNSTYDGLATASDSSSAEDLAKAIAPGAKVVKAFNTTYAGTLVAQLVKDGDMRPVDTGPLSRARQIEGMQLLHIVTQGTLGTNGGSAIKILG
jgi:predicted dinucleotide-binding enzyme